VKRPSIFAKNGGRKDRIDFESELVGFGLPCPPDRDVLFAGEGGNGRGGTRFAKVEDAQSDRPEGFDVAIVKEAVQTATMAGWIVAFIVKWKPGRTRWRTDATVRAAGAATMVPNDEPIAGLGYRGVSLAGGAAGAVIHTVTALPIGLFGTFENLGGLKEG